MIYLKLIACTLIWGGTFIAGHIVSNALPPLTAAAIRFSIAAALLLVLAWKREGGLPRLSMQQLGATAALGLTGIFLGKMEASRSALFIAMNPIVTALAAAAVLRERLNWQKWAGIGIAFLGATVLITRGEPMAALHDISQSIGMGELMMLGAASCWAAYTLVGRSALKGLSPIAATTYASLWGLGFLLLTAARELPGIAWTSLGWEVWASVTYLGAFGTVVAFVWWYEGVKALGPARTAVFNNLVPVFGVSLAALMLGEQVMASMVAGGLLVATGVTITNR
jgi:drug/metabolite transporter (DMT)-like permease